MTSNEKDIIIAYVTKQLERVDFLINGSVDDSDDLFMQGKRAAYIQVLMLMDDLKL